MYIMKIIELHILQSYPVSCLNRDDVGSPKSAIFGGHQRARISSQCLKRAVRLYAKEIAPNFEGVRGRFLHALFKTALSQAGLDEDPAEKNAKVLCELFSKPDSKHPDQVTTAVYLSPKEIKEFADFFANQKEPKKPTDLHAPFKTALVNVGLDDEAAEKKAHELCKQFSKFCKVNLYWVTPSTNKINQIAKKIADGNHPKKAIEEAHEKEINQANKRVFKKAIKKANRLDAADITLFGRMVANDASLNVEGAAMFSHALSTHKSTNEVDFYTAVDETKTESEDVGAAMTGTLEYSSATYYRYVALNLDLLFDDKHLALLDTDERKAVVDAFIRATLMSVPSARKNSMNANTLPFEVLATYKKQGQPIQLVNAFETPIIAIPGNGLAERSLEALKAELTKLKDIWGIEHSEELWLSEEGLSQLIEKLTSHVQ